MNVVGSKNFGVSREDDLAFFNTVTLFREVPESELLAIRKIARYESFTAGQLILKEGDPTNDLLIVREGTVTVFVNRDGKKIEITQIGPTSYFGEMSVFDDYPRSANVEATTDVVACRIEREAFRAFVRANPAALFQMCTVFSHRLRNTNSALTKR
jgi:CRP-like cAMP-binding protein